ncbi:hypothetical protein WMW71_02240 [Flavobacterium buctense]|uniref:Uncharacterized protein n=1 Tax=Flavobacterium buctense TaxID=1648146 RepID=A0ABU9DZQ3_9FLAO|nr:hypothetical protein [Flavobacterium buctense]
MAEQKGLIKLTGTIDGVSFYFRKGKPVARKAGGGFSSEKVKHSPAMVRTRENSSEFGHVSKFKRLFRLGLFPFLNGFTDSTLHGRLMSLFQTIKTFDRVSVRGQRSLGIALGTPEGQSLLKKFVFSEQSVSQLLRSRLVFDAASATLTVADFSAQALKFPLGSSVAEVQFGVLRIDYAQAKTELFMSNAHYITPTDTETQFTMTPTVLPTGTGVFIAVAGVKFYEVVNGERYLVKSLGELGVEVLGVW